MLDQSIIQFTEAASGTEQQRLIAQVFPSDENPEGKVVIINYDELPASVKAAITTLKNYCQPLIDQA